VEGFSFQGGYEDRQGREAIVWWAEPSTRGRVPGYELHTVIRGTLFWGCDFVRWAMRKYMRLHRSYRQARRFLAGVARREPGLFAHWELVRPSGR
jgi:hypothetical protein